jgi:hypothetical protein
MIAFVVFVFIMVIKYVVDQINRVNADMYAYVKHAQKRLEGLKAADIHSTGSVTIGSGEGKGSIFQGDADGNMTIMSKNNVVLAATTQSGFPDRVITVDPTGTISIVNPFQQSNATNMTIKIIPGIDSVTIQSPNVIIQGDLEVRGKIVNAHLE